MRPTPAAPAATGRIRTLVADDEPLARDLMSSLVRRDPELELVHDARTGSEALSVIQRYAPELVLLDIQMPDLDGISVAEQLTNAEWRPYVVFVTAHDCFALQAFGVEVRDYLVKPVSKRRFAAAIERAKAAIRGSERGADRANSLTVRRGEDLVSLRPDDIIWVAAANQYVRLHAADGNNYVLSQSLRQFARNMPTASFTRIHRSTLINCRHLDGVQSSEGRYRVRMSDGSVHDIARSRRSLVPALLDAVRSAK